MASIIGKLESFNDLPHITEKQLHALVAKFIEAHGGEPAAEWVSRYTNIYQPSPEDLDELTVEDRDKLVPARSARVVRSLLEEFLCKEFDVEQRLLHELIESKEVVEMTNQMVRIIRFNGLQSARVDTLRSLMRTRRAIPRNRSSRRSCATTLLR